MSNTFGADHDFSPRGRKQLWGFKEPEKVVDGGQPETEKESGSLTISNSVLLINKGNVEAFNQEYNKQLDEAIKKDGKIFSPNYHKNLPRAKSISRKRISVTPNNRANIPTIQKRPATKLNFKEIYGKQPPKKRSSRKYETSGKIREIKRCHLPSHLRCEKKKSECENCQSFRAKTEETI